MMIIIWSILSALGLFVTAWYLSSIFNPHGRLNYPMILWKNTGHYISWFLIMVGIVSLFGLYFSTQDFILFVKILGGILFLLMIIKTKLTPMEMSFNDAMRSLYSEGGLRFGGFQTSDFFEATEPLEKKQPGIRRKFIGEAHYLILWLHKFPEIAFLLGIVLYKNIWTASLLFIAAFVFEFIRFYMFGSSLFLSNVCRFWNWIKIPVFVITSIVLWPDGKLLPLVLLIFLIAQGWFDLVATIGMLPIRLIGGRIIYKKYGGHSYNIEGMALNYVINSWRLKLFPADKFNYLKKDRKK